MLALLAGLAWLAPAHAQWKWRDAGGQTHVSDLPPPRDIPDKDVLQRPEVTVRRPAPAVASASAASSPATARASVDPELEQRKRFAEQDQAKRVASDERKAAEVRKENCRRAQEQVALMDSGMRVVRVKPDGEREYLDDAQRASETQRARQAIDTNCR